MKRLLFALIIVSAAVAARAQQKFVLTVERNMSCKDGSTMGRLLVDGKERARTLEPGEAKRVPAGRYSATIRADGSKKWRIELANTSNIQIHIGNYPSDTKGCILPGLDIQALTDPKTQKETCAVVGSKDALNAIAEAMSAAAKTELTSEPLAITVEVKE
jgi:Family of unknown function (DUF5675)